MQAAKSTLIYPYSTNATTTTTPTSNTLPHNLYCSRMIRPRIHLLLRRPARRLIRAPHSIPARRQLPISTSKRRRRRHAPATRKSTRHNATLTLRRAQRKAIARGRRRDRSAGPRGIPRAGTNDTALLRAVDVDVEEPAAAKGRSRGTRLRGRGASPSGCGRGGGAAAAAVFGEVFDAGGGARRLHAVGVGGHELACLQRAADVVVVPDFVEGAGLAAEGDGDAGALGGESVLDLLCGVGFGGRRRDACCGEPLCGISKLVRFSVLRMGVPRSLAES